MRFFALISTITLSIPTSAGEFSELVHRNMSRDQAANALTSDYVVCDSPDEKECLNERNTLESSRFNFAANQYGYLSGFSGATEERIHYTSDSDIEDGVFEYLERNRAAIGIEDPRNELGESLVTSLTDGTIVVKLSQNQGSITVRDSWLKILIAQNGQILFFSSSIIPTEVIRTAIDESQMACALESSSACALAAEELLADASFEGFEIERNVGSPNTWSLLARYSGIGYEGRPKAIALTACGCDFISEFTLPKMATYCAVNETNFGDYCIQSTFPCDNCNHAWPANGHAENLWNNIIQIRNTALSEFNWEEWLVCRYYPNPDGPGDPEDPEYLMDPYDDGIVAKLDYVDSNNGTHYPCTEPRRTTSINIGVNINCIDSVGHELAHAIQYSEISLGANTDIFTASLNGETADILGEFFETDPDWENHTDCIKDWTRQMHSPPRDSYKWFDSFSAPDEHGNEGILTHAAFLLGEPGTRSKYGIIVNNIPLQDTKELFWDMTVASDQQQNYEATASLIRSLAASRFGSSSYNYQQVDAAMHAVGIWNSKQVVGYMDGLSLFIPTTDRTPAVVGNEYIVYIPPFYLMYKHLYLFYVQKPSSPGVATDICYINASFENWQSHGCLGLQSQYLTTGGISAALVDGKTKLLFRSASSGNLYEATINSSMGVDSIVQKSLNTSGDNVPGISAVDGGWLYAYRSSTTGKVAWKFDAEGFHQNHEGEIPNSSGVLGQPNIKFDEQNGLIWVLWSTDQSETIVASADWAQLKKYGGVVWSVGEPHKESVYYSQVDIDGRPGLELFGDELYISYLADGPPNGQNMVWTDSCYDRNSTRCLDGDHRRAPVTNPDAHWNMPVPRSTFSIDQGTLLKYNAKLWHYSAHSGLIWRISKKAH